MNSIAQAHLLLEYLYSLLVHTRKQEGAEEQHGISGERRQKGNIGPTQASHRYLPPISISRDLRHLLDEFQELWLTQRLDMHVMV